MNVNEWARKFADGRAILAVSDGRADRSNNRVHTLKGVQTHRGYVGTVLVRIEGQRQPERVKCCFHIKAGAARKHADVMARALRRLIPAE